MADGIDIEFVRSNYKRMSDDELMRNAVQNTAGIRPEALEIVKEEILRRGLDSNIIKGIEAQNKTYTANELDDYCKIIQALSCPVCGIPGELNATLTAEAKSFILFTHYSKKLLIGCPSCLAKANDKALIISLLLGWWGLSWGIVRTIQSISVNSKSKKMLLTDGPNDLLRSFIFSKIGEIETYKSDPAKLQKIIQQHNNIS